MNRNYVLAAALCESGTLEMVRTDLVGLLLPGQAKFHWRDESDRRRRQIAEAIAQLPMRHLVVIRDLSPGERAERRRRHCLEPMLYELDELQVDMAIFESRGPADDRRDRNLLDAQRAKHAVSTDLRVDHVPGRKDPLPWIPDALCGAVTRALANPSTCKSLSRTSQ